MPGWPPSPWSSSPWSSWVGAETCLVRILVCTAFALALHAPRIPVAMCALAFYANPYAMAPARIGCDVAVHPAPTRTPYTCCGSSGRTSESLAGLGRIAHSTPFESVSSGAPRLAFVCACSILVHSVSLVASCACTLMSLVAIDLARRLLWLGHVLRGASVLHSKYSLAL